VVKALGEIIKVVIILVEIYWELGTAFQHFFTQKSKAFKLCYFFSIRDCKLNQSPEKKNSGTKTLAYDFTQLSITATKVTTSIQHLDKS
jgi:hypothetical protein